MNKTQFLEKIVESYDCENLPKTLYQMTNANLTLSENQVMAIILMIGDLRSARRVAIVQNERLTIVLSYTDLLPICTFINSCH